jgi:trimeric autotransporter adhesin
MIDIFAILAFAAAHALAGCLTTTSSSSSQSANEAQLGGETEGAYSDLDQAAELSSGAQSGEGAIAVGATTGGSSMSGAVAGGTAVRGNVGGGNVGPGGVEITTIDSSDPAVTEAALGANTTVAEASLEANAFVSQQALEDEASSATASSDTAQASIAAGVLQTQQNDAFGEAALQSAADSEADSTTALEAMGTETQQNAANALAAAQNEITAGVTPAQQFQTISGTQQGTISKVATYLTVITGIIGVIYFLRKGKLS